jgi:TOTE conflict system, Archaeo-Eukaryotic Primase domain
MADIDKINTHQMVDIFLSLFSGQPHIYGTGDRDYRHMRVVKAQVTDEVVSSHLKGIRPFGVFLLVHDKIKAIAVDFDSKDPMLPTHFLHRAKHYDISVYIERSKSKGYHCWVFFCEWVEARKARFVVNQILEDIEEPDTEVFPKQDALDANVRFGNFINAPLFGRLAAKGKTVFIDPKTFKPYPNQWKVLASVNRVSEFTLDEIIELNNLSMPPSYHFTSRGSEKGNKGRFSLPPCARKILHDGVSKYQRVSCFRLAVHFKRLGLPFDVAVAALKVWALKNKPMDGRGVIRESEICSQTSYAYNRPYTGYGCKSEAVKPFCDPLCPVKQWRDSIHGTKIKSSQDEYNEMNV